MPQVDLLVFLRVWKRLSEHLIGSHSLICLIVSSCIRVNGQEKALAKRSVCAKLWEYAIQKEYYARMQAELMPIIFPETEE